MLGHFIARSRNVHTKTRSFCKFKFSCVETEKILSVVNDCNVEDLTSRYAITKTRAKKIESFRQQKNVESIHEVLSCDGFNEKVLQTFCVSILNDGTPEDVNKKGKNRSFTIPPITTDLREHINSFTSIHCGMAGLSWATFKVSPNEQTKITHWDRRQLPESKLNLYQLAAFMANVFKAVPQSDFYVFENPTAPVAGSNKASLNAQLSQMIGMASVLAAQKNNVPIGQEGDMQVTLSNVAYLRKFLFARLCKLYIGLEQISAIDFVDDLIADTNISRAMDEHIQTVIDVDESLKSLYFASKSCDKDFLGCSLLLGITFLRLCLLKCPQSLKLLERNLK